MSLPKFPRHSLQVLRIIRAEVERPKELPSRPEHGWALRWGRHCPMGLHNSSTVPAPAQSRQFAGGRCSTQGVYEFWRSWWDDITPDQAQAAMDFIWGKQ